MLPPKSQTWRATDVSLRSEGPGNLDDEDLGQQKRPDYARRKSLVGGGRERGKRREAGRKREREKGGTRGRERKGGEEILLFLGSIWPQPCWTVPPTARLLWTTLTGTPRTEMFSHSPGCHQFDFPTVNHKDHACHSCHCPLTSTFCFLSQPEAILV